MQSIAWVALLAFGLSSPTYAAKVPTIAADAETTPIPKGETESDDSVIWVSPKNPEKSLILGTSKYEEDDDRAGGLGVYNLDGEQLNFFSGAKLNNVDIVYGVPTAKGTLDLAVASNRSVNALDLYTIDKKGSVQFAASLPLVDANGESFEPYGLCLSPVKKGQVRVFLPTKSGLLYQYSLTNEAGWSVQLNATLDLSQAVSAELDAFATQIVIKELTAEGELDELEEELEERFALEGCVYDRKSQQLYVGMENLGVWSVNTRGGQLKKPELFAPVSGSWTDIQSWDDGSKPRITDDIEGMDIIYGKDQNYLLFSTQGISEYALYGTKDQKWLGNFSLTAGKGDPISGTDGLSVTQVRLSDDYEEGLLVVHDDLNTDKDGKVLNANYKLVDLEDVLEAFDLDDLN